MSRSLSRRTALIPVILAAALALAGCSQESPVVPQVPAEPSAEASPPAEEQVVEVPTVFFLGDSITAGFDVDADTEGYPQVIADRTGWTVLFDGAVGTGYINPGAANKGNFRERAAGFPEDDSIDFVVIQGSNNDDDQGAIDEAVVETLGVVREKAPNAEIILLGPIAYDVPAQARLDIDATLARVAAEQGVRYISPEVEDWFSAEDRAVIIDPATAHPNVYGYGVIGNLIADRLEPIVDAAQNQ